MPALNVPFTDEELNIIRREADRDEVSPKDFVHTAALEAANNNRKRLVREMASSVADKSAELNRRLA